MLRSPRSLTVIRLLRSAPRAQLSLPGRGRGWPVTQDPAELLLYLLVVAVV